MKSTSILLRHIVYPLIWVLLLGKGITIQAQSQDYHPARIIVRAPGSPARAAELLQQCKRYYGISSMLRLPGIQAEVWTLPPESWREDPDRDQVAYWLHRIRRDYPHLYAQPDYRYTLQVEPNDSLYDRQHTLNNSGVCVSASGMGIYSYWDQNTRASEVIIGVIDSGVDWKHEDLAPNIWQNLGEDRDGDGRTIQWNEQMGRWELDPDDLDQVDNDGNGYTDDLIGYDFVDMDNNPMDMSAEGHGTHVSGKIAAAGNNGKGIAGICWSAQLMPLRFADSSGTGYSSTAIQALEYAMRMGAHLTNNSWGGGAEDPLLAETIMRAATLGQVFVAAAGNGHGNDNDVNPVFPASYPFDNIISVGASDCQDRLSSVSNYGWISVDIMAPGEGVLSTLPGNRYGHLSGTSMAAPYITGALALLKGSCMELSMMELKDILLENAEMKAAFAGKCSTGGRLRMPAALPCLAATSISQTIYDLLGEEETHVILETFNGDWLIGGTRRNDVNSFDNAIVFRLNSLNEIQWVLELGEPFADERFLTAIQLNDGSFLLGGTTTASEPGTTNILLSHIGSDGSIRWNRKMGGTGNARCEKLLLCRDGNLLMVATQERTDGDCWFITKLTPEGTILWAQGRCQARAKEIIEDARGNLILLGEHDDNDFTDAYLAKMDASGHLLWEKSFGTVGTEGAADITLAQDGGYLFTGSTSSGQFDLPPHAVYLAKTDSSGQIQWSRIYGGEGLDESHQLIPARGEAFLLIGQSNSNTLSIPRAFALKVEHTGELLWGKQYGGLEESGFNHGIASTEGGYLLAGRTGARSKDIYFVKLNERGESGCEEAVWDIQTQMVRLEDQQALTIEHPQLVLSLEDHPLTSNQVSLIPKPTCIDPGCGLSVRFVQLSGQTCLTETLLFENRSSGGDTSAWYVDDRLVATGGQLSWAFTQTGIHKITLRVADSICQASLTQFIYIPPLVRPELGPPIDACAKAIVLDAGIKAAQYQWFTISGEALGSLRRQRITNPGTYILKIQNECGQATSDTIEVQLSNGGSCVWPGDVDGNGQIDMMDHQLVCRYHNTRGLERTHTNLEFESQLSMDWLETMRGNLLAIDSTHNMKHADPDGNGVVDAFTDGLFIQDHIQAPYEPVSPDGGDISFRLIPRQDSLMLGETFEFDIELTRENGVVENVYGIAFSMLTSLSPKRDLDLSINGWMGEGETEVHGISYNHRARKRIDVSIARINQQTASGSGRVAKGGIIILIDDLDDPRTQSNQLFFSLSWTNVVLLDKEGHPIPLKKSHTQGTITVRYELPWKSLDITALLEGAWREETAQMSTMLHEQGLLPLTCPADTSLTLASFPEGVVDWIEVELRKPDDLFPSGIMEKRPALLMADGHIRDPITHGPLRFLAPDGAYFLVLRHRNHLAIMSAVPIEFRKGQTIDYDFRTGPSKTLNPNAQEEVSPGIWALHAGDIDQNGLLYYSGSIEGSPNDRSLILIKSNYHPAPGYYPEDINMDGKVSYTGKDSDWQLLSKKFKAISFITIIRSGVPQH
ncbi:MAG: hypothetical protein D6730_00425 [Bacteroidetes bacterium]|nr:MAG: hypothetical protein D6730_00425 [Bacteroidota bacterium]